MSQETLKAALQKTIAAVQNNASAARLVFRAETSLEEDVRCRAKVRDFPAMLVDEPPELGGGNAAMNPVELVLVALGTCQEIMYAAYASVMGVQLDEVKINVKGYLDLRGLFAMDESIPAGYQKITYETSIKSPADAATIQKLIAMAEGHCPLLDTLKRPVEVSGHVTLNGQRLEMPVSVAA
jgi:putative redox protein